MPDGESKDSPPGILLLSLAIESHQSKFDNSRRGHSSVGRAPALQAGSQGFESPCLQSRKPSGLSRRSLGEGGHLFGLPRIPRELRLGKPPMTKFFYVYILQSERDERRFYTGLTDDLRK